MSISELKAEWDQVCKRLRASGKDLSQIPITYSKKEALDEYRTNQGNSQDNDRRAD